MPLAPDDLRCLWCGLILEEHHQRQCLFDPNQTYAPSIECPVCVDGIASYFGDVRRHCTYCRGRGRVTPYE